MWARGGWRERWKAALTLPEGQEDDRLDGEEFEHGFVGPEQVAGREEEEEERVESQADGEVVDDGDVEVASVDAAQREEKGMRNPRFQQYFCPCLCHVGGPRQTGRRCYPPGSAPTSTLGILERSPVELAVATLITAAHGWLRTYE